MQERGCSGTGRAVRDEEGGVGTGRLTGGSEGVEGRTGRADGVWIDPAMRSGEPCIGHTRVPVEMVINHVWIHGVDSATDMWVINRAQVLHACWYAGAGYVTRLHGKGGKYVARRGPWRKRWAGWAREVHGSLWHDDLDDIPDPPTEEQQ